jgi:hypothetical protein
MNKFGYKEVEQTQEMKKKLKNMSLFMPWLELTQRNLHTVQADHPAAIPAADAFSLPFTARTTVFPQHKIPGIVRRRIFSKLPRTRFASRLHE